MKLSVVESNPIASAQSIISEFYIQKPDDISELRTLTGICGSKKIYVKPDQLDNCAAKILIEDDNAIIVYDKNITYEPRIKFSIAHEMGHYFLHRNIRHLFEDTDEVLNKLFLSTGIEKEADQFASELLMPSNIFVETIKTCGIPMPDFNMVKHLSTVFNMSILATTLKLVRCGNYCIALIACEDKKIKWYHADSEFPYRLKPRGTVLDNTTSAYEFFSSGKHFLEHQEIYSDAWTTNAESEDIIIEHTHCSDQYGYTLTIIWKEGDVI